MKLEKAKISVEDGNDIEVMFNPNTYTITGGNEIESISKTGAPILQYKKSKSYTLQMVLDFYTYEPNIDGNKKKAKDVRVYTNKILKLLEWKSAKVRRPPVCKFVWGRTEFQGYLTSATQKFTMFSNEGIPVRADMNITFTRSGIMDLNSNLGGSFVNNAPAANENAKPAAVTQATLKKPLWKPKAKANKIDNPRKPAATSPKPSPTKANIKSKPKPKPPKPPTTPKPSKPAAKPYRSTG